MKLKMKKTLMTHVVALAGAAAMVGGLLIASAPEAEGNKTVRSGVGNDRTGNTVNNQGMMVSPSVVGSPNDDISPAAGNVTSTAPRSTNDYGTTGSNMRRDIENGR